MGWRCGQIKKQIIIADLPSYFHFQFYLTHNITPKLLVASSDLTIMYHTLKRYISPKLPIHLWQTSEVALEAPSAYGVLLSEQFTQQAQDEEYGRFYEHLVFYSLSSYLDSSLWGGKAYAKTGIRSAPKTMRLPSIHCRARS